MQGASRTAFAACRQELQSLLADASVDASQVGQELFGVVGVLDQSAALRRAVGAPASDAQTKQGLIERLLTGKVGASVVTLMREIVGRRWSVEDDIPDAVEQLAVEAVFIAADRRDKVDEVEQQLFSFERLVATTPKLRDALANRQRSGADKSRLVTTLLEGKVEPETQTLVTQAAAHPRGGRFDRVLDAYISVAARMRERLVANVTAAMALDAEREQRLARALGSMYGRPVQVNVVVDPSVLGGVRVRIGDEVIDGTIQRRLEEARRAMAG